MGPALIDHHARENCSIAPNEIRPTSSTGEPIVTDKSTADTDAETSGIPIGRMIDWVLALRLDDVDNDLISDAFASVPFARRSLNQSLTDFLRKCPNFIDFELKKEQAARDPEVQLAVWASAGLNKKKLMGWSTDLPMPGIVIDGHKWTSYLFFEQKHSAINEAKHVPTAANNAANVNGGKKRRKGQDVKPIITTQDQQSASSSPSSAVKMSSARKENVCTHTLGVVEENGQFGGCECGRAPKESQDQYIELARLRSVMLLPTGNERPKLKRHLHTQLELAP
ncbi:MAG: hypothetical protein Q9220_006173 [cf. Caloplaca sp. 1 TL-2023]